MVTVLEDNQLVGYSSLLFPSEQKGQVPNSLVVRGYEPGMKDHEFDPRL